MPGFGETAYLTKQKKHKSTTGITVAETCAS